MKRQRERAPSAVTHRLDSCRVGTTAPRESVPLMLPWPRATATRSTLILTPMIDEKLRRERIEVFGECLSDYERLRGYVARRYGDKDADPRTVAHWMADNGHGLFVEGVPEADAWRARFWPDV